MPEQLQRPPSPTYAYVDIPELSETLADSVHSLFFDGQTLRITFAVNRMDFSISKSEHWQTLSSLPTCVDGGGNSRIG